MAKRPLHHYVLLAALAVTLLSPAFGAAPPTPALALSSGRDVTVFVALTLARSGEPGQAQALVQKLESQYPSNALLKRFWLPTVDAAIDIDNGRDQHAITALEVAAPCEQGTGGTFIRSSARRLQHSCWRGSATSRLQDVVDLG